MTREDSWIIACTVAVVLISPLYGYLIGAAGRRRSWDGPAIKRVAAAPLALIAGAGQIAAMLVSHYETPRPVWTVLPWPIILLGGFIALFVAAKTAGVSIKREPGENLSTR